MNNEDKLSDADMDAMSDSMNAAYKAFLAGRIQPLSEAQKARLAIVEVSKEDAEAAYWQSL